MSSETSSLSSRPSACQPVSSVIPTSHVQSQFPNAAFPNITQGTQGSANNPSQPQISPFILQTHSRPGYDSANMRRMKGALTCGQGMMWTGYERPQRWSQESKARGVFRTGLASLEQELWAPSVYPEIKASPGQPQTLL